MEELHRLYEKLGAHPQRDGVRFALWAPYAERVTVIGEFNGWEHGRNPMERDGDGVWSGVAPEARAGQLYKYHVVSGGGGADQPDPFAFRVEPAPGTASIIWDLCYQWQDADWTLSWRPGRALDRPIAAYEVHLPSWRRVPEENNRSLSYREAGPRLSAYATEMGFTHVELRPLAAPGSFAPYGRYGSPQDLMFLVDCLHGDGIAAVLDWPWPDPAVTRPEMTAANALHWIDRYHFDGLRAVPRADAASLTEIVHDAEPHALLLEAGPPGSAPVESGFDLVWDTAWERAVLEYMALDPILRKNAHDKLAVRAAADGRVVPLSREALPLPARMPGDDWQRLASVRLLLSYQYAVPGKKLLFMSTEFAQWREWDDTGSLDWHLLNDARHAGVRNLAGTLNWVYKTEPALHQLDADAAAGFEWIECCDAERSVIGFLRKGRARDDVMLAVFNFTPVPRHNYRIGVPAGGAWREILNTDAAEYGGSEQGNFGGVEATPIPSHGRRQSLTLTLPPLAGLYLKPE